MASAALVVKDDGSFEAKPELRQKLRLMPGARLELVQQSGEELRFRVPLPMKQINGWRDLQGILADLPVDPNLELERERLAELDRDAR